MTLKITGSPLSRELPLKLPDLHKELIQVILLKLPLHNFLTCSLVSRDMHQITSENDLWGCLYLRDFRSPPPLRNSSLEMYKNCRTYQSNLEKGVYASHKL